MRDADDNRFDPYNADRPLLMRCACGQHASADEHNSALSAVNELKRRSETSEDLARG